MSNCAVVGARDSGRRSGEVKRGRQIVQLLDLVRGNVCIQLLDKPVVTGGPVEGQGSKE